MQLVVLGMHRSGTSMVTRLLNLLGASLGPAEYIVDPDAKNPSGYWERSDVFAINEDVLNAADAAWDRPESFDPARVPEDAARLFRERAAAIVASLDACRPWVMKDPRLSILLPLWRPLLASPLGVLVHRHPLEVADSLRKRDGFDEARSLALWESYARSALRTTADLPRIFVSYDAIIADPRTSIRQLAGDLARHGFANRRDPSDDALVRFVDESLCHHRATAGNGGMTDRQVRLYESLRSGAR